MQGLYPHSLAKTCHHSPPLTSCMCLLDTGPSNKSFSFSLAIATVLLIRQSMGLGEGRGLTSDAKVNHLDAQWWKDEQKNNIDPV